MTRSLCASVSQRNENHFTSFKECCEKTVPAHTASQLHLVDTGVKLSTSSYALAMICASTAHGSNVRRSERTPQFSVQSVFSRIPGFVDSVEEAGQSFCFRPKTASRRAFSTTACTTRTGTR